MKTYDTAFDELLDRAVILSKSLTRQLEDIQHAENMDPEDIYQLSLSAAYSGEKMALRLRTLPCWTGKESAKDDVNAIIKAAVPVEIGYTKENWFILRLPLLLPKKEQCKRDYINGIVYPVFSDFCMKMDQIRYGKCVIVFRHVYDHKRQKRHYRDHDNIEINQIVDVMALWLMVDDAPMRCCHFYCSAVAEKERTEVYLVPIEDFPKWLEQEPNIPDKGVDIFPKPILNPQKDR